MNKLLMSTLVSAGLIAASALPVFAQAPAAGGDGPQARQFARGQHQEQRAFRLPSERAEARLAYLKTALKITDAQQTQWDAFANTLRKQARESDKRVQERRSSTAGREKGARPTAIQRMERGQARMATASARLGETLAAAKPLYAALSPDQQKIADELLAPRGRGGPGHRGGRRHS